MRRIAVALFTLAIGAIIPAGQAEIVKTAVPDCKNNQICFYWWPKLPELTGWHGDQELNLKLGSNGSNVLIPDGQTFSNAPAIIYGRAILIKRYDWEFKVKSTLDSFITDDKETFAKEGAAVAEASALTTADGQTLKLVSYKRAQNIELVAYGEETDKDGNRYYLLFVISAKSEEALQQALPMYQELIAHYRA